MNDFMRPALYDAQHDIFPLQKIAKRLKDQLNLLVLSVNQLANLLIYKNYQKISENDFVAIITNVGAYGSSLSSNYNTRPLIAEILVNKKKSNLLERDKS